VYAEEGPTDRSRGKPQFSLGAQSHHPQASLPSPALGRDWSTLPVCLGSASGIWLKEEAALPLALIPTSRSPDGPALEGSLAPPPCQGGKALSNKLSTPTALQCERPQAEGSALC
jgi:hypothetical protein